jgi:ketosteroid isomerase-like protein
MGLLRWIVSAALGLASLGCEDERTGEARPEQAAAPASSAPAAETAPASRAVAAIPEPAVRDLVDRWVAAQNAGELDAYAASYASRFEGIKRAGPRTYRFDRASWLDDRRRMFARPMEVAIRDLEVSVTGKVAVVTFEQTWTSATFRDVGPKQLVLVEEEGGPRIAREEMLQSTLDARAGSDAPPLDLFMLVIHAGTPHVVLHGHPEETWAAGTVTLLRREEPMAVARDAVASALPAELGAWDGRRVRLFGASGEVCTATVRGLRVVRRVTPHFGVGQAWSGEHGDPPATQQQIADDTWSIAGAEGALFVGALQPDGAGCERGLFARAADAPLPAIYAPAPLEGQAREAALRALRALPAHAQIQRDYASYPDVTRNAAWYEHDGASPAVMRFAHAGTGRALVTVRARAGNGCGDFFGELWGAFEATATSTALRPAVDPDSPGAFEPLAAADLDGDGTIEIVVPDGLVRTGAGAHQVLFDVTPPFLDCGC